MKFCLQLLGLLMLVTGESAQASEAMMRNKLCAGTTLELRLKSGVRVDCVSPTHAIEVEFSHKWAEAIGQSLAYAKELNRRPGIILICKTKTRPTTCLKHGYQIEQTFSHWKNALTLWQCDETAVSLSDCLKKEFN